MVVLVPSSSGPGRLVLIQKIAGSTPAGITRSKINPVGVCFVSGGMMRRRRTRKGSKRRSGRSQKESITRFLSAATAEIYEVNLSRRNHHFAEKRPSGLFFVAWGFFVRSGYINDMSRWNGGHMHISAQNLYSIIRTAFSNLDYAPQFACGEETCDLYFNEYQSFTRSLRCLAI